MMFTVFGALGPLLVGMLTDSFGGGDALNRALALSAAILLPLSAAIMVQGVRPYGHAMREASAGRPGGD
jgi:hypothetical protein